MSNCSNDKPSKKQKTTNVTSSTESSQDAVQGPEDEIVMPPDNLIAQEIAEGPQDLNEKPDCAVAIKGDSPAGDQKAKDDTSCKTKGGPNKYHDKLY